MPLRQHTNGSNTLNLLGGARKVPLKVVFLILEYYLGLAICTDSYVGGFVFAPPFYIILNLYFAKYLELLVPLLRYCIWTLRKH